MTEDEAKTKWCPFARVFHMPMKPRAPAYNRVVIYDDDDPEASTYDKECRCVASGCMAWRWSEDPWAKRFVSGSSWRDPQEDGATSEKRERTIKPEERRGYCGLAGKP